MSTRRFRIRDTALAFFEFAAVLSKDADVRIVDMDVRAISLDFVQLFLIPVPLGPVAPPRSSKFLIRERFARPKPNIVCTHDFALATPWLGRRTAHA
jgi:hypothetical protein